MEPGEDLGVQLRTHLSAHLNVRRYRKGTLIWREGEESGLLVAIKSGRVKTYRLLPNGRAVTLSLLGPGDVFGFLPLLDGRPYPAYAQALEDVEADVMPRATLLQALRADPGLAVTLIGLLGRRLRQAFDLIEALSTPGAVNRVAAALLGALAEEHAGASPVIALPVTSQEFAGAIGVAPETFSRAVKQLEDKGILAREGAGHYRVLDREGLRLSAAPPAD